MFTDIDSLQPFFLERFNEFSQYSEGVLNEYDFQNCLFFIQDSQINGNVSVNKTTHILKRNRFNTNIDTTIIICSKDHGHILKYSLEKLKLFEANAKYDILLVDDRSVSQDILNLSDEYNTSYLRIDNSLDKFNYSMLNNVAAAYCKAFNKETVIFYNNDLWPSNANSLDNIVDTHKKEKSSITGCKLTYPSRSEYESLGKPQHLLQPYLEKIYGTIQHGGVFFFPRQSLFIDKQRTYFHENFVLGPIHLYRFYPENHHIASTNSFCCAVTGALQVVNLKDFWELNGFNMLMTTSFQDIDICIRATKKQFSVLYVGSEKMIHAESITNASEKITNKPEFLSDNITWDIVWGAELPHIIGYSGYNKLSS